MAISWLLHSWAAYVASTPALAEVINTSLVFIVRGDGYPTAGVEWANLTSSLAGKRPNDVGAHLKVWDSPENPDENLGKPGRPQTKKIWAIDIP